MSDTPGLETGRAGAAQVTGPGAPRRSRLRSPVRLWMLKAVAQKTISVLPASHTLNSGFQRFVTRRQKMTATGLANKLRRVQDHLDGYAEISGKGRPGVVLELGTGWYPVVPLALALAGVERVLSVDITCHVTPTSLRDAARAVISAADEPPEGVAWRPDPERLATLRAAVPDGEPLPVEVVAGRLGIEFIVGDAGTLDLPDRSVDLIVSNNTLEHIPAPVIRHILTRFRGLLAEDGVMSHFIDLSDHFAHLDKSITIYNFLRFSERQWRWIDNDIQPQNRMRCADHQEMHRELGFEVVRTDPWPGDIQALRATRLHPDFRRRPEAEVAISHCHLYSVAA